MKATNDNPTSIVLQALQAQNAAAYQQEEAYKATTNALLLEKLAEFGADVSTLEVRNSGNSTYNIRLASAANWYHELEIRVDEGWNYRRRDADNTASRYFESWYVNMPSRKISSVDSEEHKALYLLGFSIAQEALKADSEFTDFLSESYNQAVALHDAFAPLREAIGVEINRLKEAAKLAAKEAIVAQVGDFYAVGNVWARVLPRRYSMGELKVEMRKVVKVTAKRVYVAREVTRYNGDPMWSDCGHVDKVDWEALVLRNGMRPVCALIDNK